MDQIMTTSETNSRYFNTPRLLIRAMAKQDEALFCELFCSERIMANIDDTFGLDRAKNAFKCTLRESDKPDSSTLCWVISYGGQEVGLVSLNNICTGAGADVGIMLLKVGQGNQLADEAIDWLAKYAFGELGLNCLHAEFTAKNLATKRITRKFGFTNPHQHPEKRAWQQCILQKRDFKSMF
ncbi:GNAT family N-acetyltransferase [Shewanella submarina]|uniref:GNAT family N-acetyltransferase n=1 Tax=Shewanella submarina TaxID=2016376 RepID=A0ABV7GAY2_9GAMM|nr:GNAT family N-acetyltransferase [Shewanella submarina]MCL1036779.1 GNAT family N-acetyltransferase [Shewanella submarina]